MKAADIKLAYLLISTPMPNTYIGGVMVTDGRGLPLEFRYTEPIQPTKIQQVLYGQVLSSYIKREVILETLLKGLETKFKHMLVEDENLINYAARGFSIVRISQTKSSPLGALGTHQNISPTEIMLQASAEGSPIRLHFADPKTLIESPATVEEKAAKTTSTATATAEKPPSGNGTPSGNDTFGLLVEAGKTMDIYEPLKRIEKALDIICQEAGITSQTS